jgi:hypothetical protein
MTTRQLYDVLSGEAYRRMLRRSGDERGLNHRLTDYCENTQQTLPEAIQSCTAAEWIYGKQG